MRVVSIDIYRLGVIAMFLIGSAVIVAGSMGVLSDEVSRLGSVALVASLLVEAESVVARIREREYQAFKHGRDVGAELCEFPRPRATSDREHVHH